jgi:hypothetical protein
MQPSARNYFAEKDYSKPDRLRILREIYNDPDRKPMFRIISEILYLSYLNRRFPPSYYTARFLFKKGADNIRDYCSDELFSKLNMHFNEDGARDVLENKLFFSLFYSQFNIPIPKLLGYNHKGMFVIDKEVITISDTGDFKKFLNRISDKIPDNDSIFIKKTWGTYGGDRVFKLYKVQITDDPEYINDLFKIVAESEYVFQERIIQHPLMDSFNSSCVNTIRIDTFIDKDGRAEAMSAYLRTSFNGLHVDNCSSGGCEIPVNIETGSLKKYGYMEIEDYGARLPEVHPVTNVRFEDFVIPYFEEVRKLVCRTALLMPKLRLIGWDVAIGISGPVLIEGNSFYDIGGSDLSYGGYYSNPVFKKALEEAGHGRK